MISENQSKNKQYLFAICITLLIIGIFYIASSKFSKDSESVYCTEEAKLCPDGSYVGRTGPNCEFAACPDENNDAWNTASSSGITFQYPKTLATEYIHATDWPPQVQVLDESFTCNEAGSEMDRAGQTKKLMIEDRTYCITKESEGAAGSIYTNYSYAFPKDNKTIIFTFSLRAVQCANYDELQKSACENEKSSFNINSIMDRIVRSIK